MSDLGTYYYPSDHDFVQRDAQQTKDGKYSDGSLAVNLWPGDWVKHRSGGGLGMLIANGDDFITILWSVQPTHNMPDSGFVFAPYVPLQVTPTIIPSDDFKTSSAHYAKKSIIETFYSKIKLGDL